MSELSPYETMPKTVRIGFSTFKIEVMPRHHADIAGGICGTSNGTKQIITITEGQNPQQTANTFLHEVIHAIHWVYGLMSREDPAEEEYTNLTTNGLCAFWQDNPAAVAWIGEMLSRHE